MWHHTRNTTGCALGSGAPPGFGPRRPSRGSLPPHCEPWRPWMESPMMRALLTLIMLSVSLVATPALAAPFAYVPNSFSDTVSVIDAATNTVVATVAVGSRPVGVAVSPDGRRVYITNTSSDSVSVLDATNNTVAATVSVGDSPLGVAVHPNGTRVYVANQLSGTVSVIDAVNNTVVTQIPVGSRPSGITV